MQQRQVRVLMVLKTVVFPKLQFTACRRLPFRAAEAHPHGPVCSADLRGSPVAVRRQVVDVPILQVVQVVDISFVTQRLIPMVFVTMVIPRSLVDMVKSPIMQVVLVARVSQVLVVKITVVIPQLQHIQTSSCVDKGVHMPVVCNDRSLTSLS